MQDCLDESELDATITFNDLIVPQIMDHMAVDEMLQIERDRTTKKSLLHASCLMRGGQNT